MAKVDKQAWIDLVDENMRKAQERKQNLLDSGSVSDLCRLAESLKDPDYYYGLSMRYGKGLNGTKKNVYEGLYYMRLAAKNGHSTALKQYVPLAIKYDVYIEAIISIYNLGLEQGIQYDKSVEDEIKKRKQEVICEYGIPKGQKVKSSSNHKHISYKKEDEYRIHEILATKKYNSVWTYDEMRIATGFSKNEVRHIIDVLKKNHVILLDYKTENLFKLKFLAPFDDEYDRYVDWYDSNVLTSKICKALFVLALVFMPVIGYLWHWSVALVYGIVVIIFGIPISRGYKDITHTFINDELKMMEKAFNFSFGNRLKITDTFVGESYTTLVVSVPRKIYNGFVHRYDKSGIHGNADLSFNKKYCLISISWPNSGITFSISNSLGLNKIIYFKAEGRRISYNSEPVYHDGCCVLLLPIISCIITYFVS